MRTIVSAVVTPDDVMSYVKGKNPRIKSSKGEDGSVSVESSQFSFWFKPKGVRWKVRIEATDDPDDSDEEVTTEPVKFIAKFLGAGVPGGEHFERMSAGPEWTAGLLKHLASMAEDGSVGPRRLCAVLRRAAVAPNADLLRRVISAVCRTAAGQSVSLEEVKKLQEEMSKKGWKVKEGETDAGVPELTVEVSGIYEAKVRPESLPYEFELQTVGFPDLRETGVSEDPIAEIRKYAKREDVNIALEDRKRRELETGDTEAAPASGFKPAKGIAPEMGGTEKTAPAKSKPDREGIREEKTVAPDRAK